MALMDLQGLTVENSDHPGRSSLSVHCGSRASVTICDS
ncbi:SapB/AmfS family lanthipeptide [Actinomadura chibensis]